MSRNSSGSHGGSGNSHRMSTSSIAESSQRGSRPQISITRQPFPQFGQPQVPRQQSYPLQNPYMAQPLFPTQRPYSFMQQMSNPAQQSAQSMMNSIHMYRNILTEGSSSQPPMVPFLMHQMIDSGAGLARPSIGGVPHHMPVTPNVQATRPTLDARYSGTSAGAGGQTSEQSHGELFVCDKALGKDLLPGKNTKLTQLPYESCPHPSNQKDQPQILTGRKEKKLTKPELSMERRPWIQPLKGRNALTLLIAETDIGAALRVHFRGDQVWDDVLPGNSCGKNLG